MPWDDDEYAYEECPDSFLDGPIQHRDDMLEWAENEGMRRLINTREGATFVQYGKIWLIALYGGQPIHHDRHMSDLEDGSQDTWNIVARGNPDQMLVTEVAQDIFNHIPLEKRSAIYLNTTNRHLVTRTHGNEVSILLQIHGYGPEQRAEAMHEMYRVWLEETGRHPALA